MINFFLPSVLSCRFYYVCQIGSTIFGEGAGNKKGAAKCNAAKAAYEQLNAQQTSRVCINLTITKRNKLACISIY